MNNEITKNLMCLAIRNGVELWIEENKLGNMVVLLEKNKFNIIDGRLVNTADVVGIFKASDMADYTRRKNGQWQDEEGEWRNRGEWKCDYGNWHTKNDWCKCTNSLGYRNPPKKI